MLGREVALGMCEARVPLRRRLERCGAVEEQGQVLARARMQAWAPAELQPSTETPVGESPILARTRMQTWAPTKLQAAPTAQSAQEEVTR